MPRTRKQKYTSGQEMQPFPEEADNFKSDSDSGQEMQSYPEEDDHTKSDSDSGSEEGERLGQTGSSSGIVWRLIKLMVWGTLFGTICLYYTAVPWLIVGFTASKHCRQGDYDQHPELLFVGLPTRAELKFFMQLESSAPMILDVLLRKIVKIIVTGETDEYKMRSGLWPANLTLMHAAWKGFWLQPLRPLTLCSVGHVALYKAIGRTAVTLMVAIAWVKAARSTAAILTMCVLLYVHMSSSPAFPQLPFI